VELALDTYALQVKMPDSKWYWVDYPDFGMEYSTGSYMINSDTIWFQKKSETEEFASNWGICTGEEITVLKDNGCDTTERIESVRIVKMEAVEV